MDPWNADTRENRTSFAMLRSQSRGGRVNSTTLANKMASPLSREYETQTAEVFADLMKVTGSFRAEEAVVDSAGFTLAMHAAKIDREFSRRLFEHLDTENMGLVPMSRVVRALFALQHAGLEGRLRITFELFDVDRSGSIDRQELFEILKVSFGGLGVRVSDEQLHMTADSMMAVGLAERNGITLPEAREIISGSRSTSSADATDTILDIGDEVNHVIPVTNFAPPPAELMPGGQLNMEDLDEASLTFAELMSMLHEHNHLMPAAVPRQEASHVTTFAAKMFDHASTLYKKVTYAQFVPFYVFLWLVLAGAFVGGYVHNYKSLSARVAGPSLPIAKGFAQVIQVILCVLLIPVSRRTVTVLRSTPLRHVIPIDDSITLHRLLGGVLALCAIGHVGAHVNNYIQLAHSSKWHVWHGVTTPQPSDRTLWTNQTSITGYIGVLAILVGYPFALRHPRQFEWVKKTWVGKNVLNNFTWFYSTHLLMFSVFFVAIILHPWPGRPGYAHDHGRSTTWIWMLPGLVVYLVERITRWIWPAVRTAQLLDVQLLGTKERVICLRVAKPVSFHYSPGQYTFVSVPSVGAQEWHPFTITSAPGDPYISVHIRVVGDWTESLWYTMEEYLKRVRETIAPAGSTHSEALAAHAHSLSSMASFARSSNSFNSSAMDQATGSHGFISNLYHKSWHTKHQPLKGRENLPLPPKVLLDGPYAAPAQHWNEYEVLLLVGAGIGVTPFASVLADLVNRMDSQRCRLCGELDHTRIGTSSHGPATQKIYFYWTVRDSQAPSYFKSTLETISQNDKVGMVEANIHLTGVASSGGSDLRYIIARIGQQAMHAQTGVDVVTGLQSKVVTAFGRPKWDKIFQDIQDKHLGKRVGVFVCGPKVLSDDLRRMCRKHNPHLHELHSTRVTATEEIFDINMVPASEMKEELEELNGQKGCEQSAILQPAVFDFYTEVF